MSGYYVYLLIDPRDGQPFYVGKGKGNRAQQHEKDARAGRIVNAAKCARILEIESLGMAVECSYVRTGLTEREAFDLERRMIAYHKPTLTNIASGVTDKLERQKLQARIMLSQLMPKDFWLNRRSPGLLAAERLSQSIGITTSDLYDKIRGEMEAIAECGWQDTLVVTGGAAP